MTRICHKGANLYLSILQGVLTCFAGIIGAFTICDFPENAANGAKSLALPFLNKEEAEFVVARIEKDRHDAIAEEFNIGQYLKCAADLKVWVSPLCNRLQDMHEF